VKYEELGDLIEQAFKDAPATAFPSVDEALKIVGAGLRYLADRCEVEDDSKESGSDQHVQQG
jgi:hypothetical protein